MAELVKYVTLAMLEKGRNPAVNEDKLKDWNKLLFKILQDSWSYPSPMGRDVLAQEIKIAAKCKVASKTLFLQVGSAKRLADYEPVLDRTQQQREK